MPDFVGEREFLARGGRGGVDKNSGFGGGTDADGYAVYREWHRDVLKLTVLSGELIEIEGWRQFSNGQNATGHFFFWRHWILPILRSQTPTLAASAAEPARAAIANFS